MIATRIWLFSVLALTFAAIACTGFKGTESALDSVPEVRLNTSLDTVYYSVRGLTTEEIFNSVEVDGPELEGLGDGKFASGLTEDISSFKWEFLKYESYCDLEVVEISVSLVITLPEHVDPGALSAEQSARWLAFAEEVAVHEQQHVDIHIDRMKSFKSTIETFSTRFSDCDTLGSRIELAWEVERALDEQQQEEFHLSEEVRTHRVTQPIQERVDRNQAEMARLHQLINDRSTEIQNLRSATAEVGVQSESFMQGMNAIQKEYPSLALPPDVFVTFQNLLGEWNSLNEQRNAFVEEINQQVTLRNQTVDAVNLLVGETNLLLEEIAWLS
jgi:predicted secreted Zn-dependent protease